MWKCDHLEAASKYNSSETDHVRVAAPLRPCASQQIVYFLLLADGASSPGGGRTGADRHPVVGGFDSWPLDSTPTPSPFSLPPELSGPSIYPPFFSIRHREGSDRTDRTGSVCTASVSARLRKCARPSGSPGTVGWIRLVYTPPGRVEGGYLVLSSVDAGRSDSHVFTSRQFFHLAPFASERTPTFHRSPASPFPPSSAPLPSPSFVLRVDPLTRIIVRESTSFVGYATRN